MNTHGPKLLIVGTGAMACLFSARFAAAGFEVTHLGTWKEGLEALDEGGVRLVEADGWESTYPVKVARDPGDFEAAHIALVLVKSWQTARAARQLNDFLHPQGVALTLQNGLGNDTILADTLGSERVALGVTTTGATLLSPGRVKPVGDGVIMLGDHPRMKPLIQHLTTAGFRVEVVENTASLVWGKLVVNSAINPLTALLKVNNGALIERPAARDLLARSGLETAAVARAHRISLPYADPVQFVEGVVLQTAENCSSMLSDILRGRQTEVDAINGAVVRSGEKVGVPTPINWTFWKLIKSLENVSKDDVNLKNEQLARVC